MFVLTRSWLLVLVKTAEAIGQKRKKKQNKPENKIVWPPLFMLIFF